MEKRRQGDPAAQCLLEAQSSQSLLTGYSHRVRTYSAPPPCHLRLPSSGDKQTNSAFQLFRFKQLQPTQQGDCTYRKGEEENQHLDEYFPFDPYHLPKSKRWIEGDYREWTGIPGLDNEKAAESDSGEGEMEDSDVEEGTETEESDE